MKTYIAILKDDVVLNTDILNYFTKMEFIILDYYPKLKVLKLESKMALDQITLKYLKSIEEEKTFNI